MARKSFSAPYLKAKFGSVATYTFTIPVKYLIPMYYVAVRGVDHEEGAVQRVLSKRRISSVKNYILDGNQFFNSFILNWTDSQHSPGIDDEKIKLPLIPGSTQVIDGQHRLAGYEAAIEEDESVGDHRILVTLCIGLKTNEAARIFLNINTEQKPVPKSLIFDLFGEVENDEDHAINRGADIARQLNEDPESPLFKLIKFPGAPRGMGAIELSTFVSALKPALKKDGVFIKYKLKTFDYQVAALTNFFDALKSYYDKKEIWSVKSKNPFLRAAGFNGSIDYFLDHMIPECAKNKSFEKRTMKELLGLDSQELLTWDDLKGNDGKTARRKVKEFLEQNIIESIPDQNEYSF